MALRFGLASAWFVVLAASCHLVGGLDDYSFDGLGGGGATTSSGSGGSSSGTGGTGGAVGGSGGGGIGGGTAATCGDGSVDVGEICYGGTPLSRPAGTPWVKDMALTDCDGDGDTDVIILGSLTNDATGLAQLSALPNEGNGTLLAAKTSMVSSYNPVSVEPAHLDVDDTVDLVLGINRPGAETILLYAGDGACGFSLFETVYVQLPLFDAVPLRLDNDTRDDVTATMGNGSLSYLVSYGSIAGPPADQQSISAVEPVAVAVGPMDNPTADAVYVDAANDKVWVAVQEAGAFAAPVSFPSGSGTTGARPVALAVDELDGDGHVDVITADHDGNSVTTLFNNGTGSLELGASSSIVGASGVSGAGPVAIALGDVDGDGDLDAITANDGAGGEASLTLLINQGGVFTVADSAVFAGVEKSFPIALSYRPVRVALADMNADGALDIVWVRVNDTTGGADAMILLANP